MGHIKREFITIAKGRSKELARNLEVLSKFAVLGVVSPHDYDMVVAYLKDIGAKFTTKGKTLIWLDILPESLQEMFTRKPKKKSKQL